MKFLLELLGHISDIQSFADLYNIITDESEPFWIVMMWIFIVFGGIFLMQSVFMYVRIRKSVKQSNGKPAKVRFMYIGKLYEREFSDTSDVHIHRLLVLVVLVGCAVISFIAVIIQLILSFSCQ